MIVYLAGAIDLVDDGERHAWRQKMKTELASRKMSSYDPAAAFKYTPQSKADAQRLIEINKQALYNCDMAVFVMGRNAPSIGTPIELYMARDRGLRHVVIWEPSFESFDDTSIKKVRVGGLPAYVQGIASKVVYRFDDALDYIVDMERKKDSICSGAISTLNMDGIGALSPAHR